MYALTAVGAAESPKSGVVTLDCGRSLSGMAEGLTFSSSSARSPRRRALLGGVREIDWPGGETSRAFAARLTLLADELDSGDSDEGRTVHR